MEAWLKGRRGSVCLQSDSPGQLRRDSPGQPKRSMRVATAVRYNYYVQWVIIERNWMRVANSNFARGGGVNLVMHKAVLRTVIFTDTGVSS